MTAVENAAQLFAKSRTALRGAAVGAVPNYFGLSCMNDKCGQRLFVTKEGVTSLTPSGYNRSVMSRVCDAAQQFQFGHGQLATSLRTSSLCVSGRVLAALFGVSAAVSGKSAFAIAA